jgi:hypothetical protein
MREAAAYWIARSSRAMTGLLVAPSGRLTIDWFGGISRAIAIATSLPAPANPRQQASATSNNFNFLNQPEKSS